MKEIPLKERLIRYFKKHHTAWIPSGEIQRLVATYTTQTPRTCVRRLQEMAEEGILERKLVKGHTHYRLKPQVSIADHQRGVIEMWNGV
jgi:hypothetical protein